MAAPSLLKQTLRGDNAQRVLVVDDARETQQMIALQLERAGYHVVTADDGLRALELIRRQGLPRLVVLDLSLPGKDGFTVAKEIRAIGDVPIVLLALMTDTIVPMDYKLAGIRNYLLKPFAFLELLEAVQNALREGDTPPMSDREFRLDANVCINFAQQCLFIDGQKALLTPTETRLLHLLYSNRGRVVSPGYLMSKAWCTDQKGTLGSLWVHIRRLRNKLEPNPESPAYLITVRGQGYCLHSDSVYSDSYGTAVN